MFEAVERAFREHELGPPPSDLADEILQLDALGDSPTHPLRDVVSFLDRTRDRIDGAPLVLAFDEPDKPVSESSQAIYMHGRVQTLLTGLLLGERFGDLPVVAIVPRDPAAVLTLVRSGLFFAFANRRGRCVVVLGGADPFPTDESAEADAAEAGRIIVEWSERWRPADLTFRRTVMAQTRSGPPTEQHRPTGPVQDRLVTFVNPHMVSRARVSTELTANVVAPWIQRLIGDDPGMGEAGRTSQLPLPALTGPTQLLDEVLHNLSDYAFEDFSGAASYVQLFTVPTAGGRDRLHLTVLDNGRGLLSTLRPKLTEPDADLSDTELLKRLLADKVRYGRGRGNGLAAAAAVLRGSRGTAMIVTGSTGGGAVVAQYSAGLWDVVSISWLPWSGTLAVFTLDLPDAAHDDPSRGVAGADEVPTDDETTVLADLVGSLRL